MGVGTATIIKSAFPIIVGSLVAENFTAALKAPASTSPVLSTPLRQFSTRDSLISKPMVSYCFPNSRARGSPTYPKPTTAMTGLCIMMVGSVILPIFPEKTIRSEQQGIVAAGPHDCLIERLTRRASQGLHPACYQSFGIHNPI